jgi:hypothetical protein
MIAAAWNLVEVSDPLNLMYQWQHIMEMEK